MDTPCEPLLPAGTQAWVLWGRYRGLRVTLLEFRADLIIHDDPFAERADHGFYIGSVLLRDVEAGRVTDLIPRRFISLSHPGWRA